MKHKLLTLLLFALLLTSCNKTISDIDYFKDLDQADNVEFYSEEGYATLTKETIQSIKNISVFKIKNASEIKANGKLYEVEFKKDEHLIYTFRFYVKNDKAEIKINKYDDKHRGLPEKLYITTDKETIDIIKNLCTEIGDKK